MTKFEKFAQKHDTLLFYIATLFMFYLVLTSKPIIGSIVTFIVIGSYGMWAGIKLKEYEVKRNGE